MFNLSSRTQNEHDVLNNYLNREPLRAEQVSLFSLL